MAAAHHNTIVVESGGVGVLAGHGLVTNDDGRARIQSDGPGHLAPLTCMNTDDGGLCDPHTDRIFGLRTRSFSYVFAACGVHYAAEMLRGLPVG